MITIQINDSLSPAVLKTTASYLLQLEKAIYGDNRQRELPLETPVAVDSPTPSEPLAAPVAPAHTPVAVDSPTSSELPASTDPAQEEELDSRGFPWDKRIHATTKAKLKNGEWRNLRGVSDVLVRQVEAELREQQHASNAGKDNAQPTPEAPVKVQAPVAWPGGALEAAPAPAATTDTAPKSHTQLVNLVVEKVNENVENGVAIQEVVSSLGFGSVNELATAEPETIGEAYAKIEAL